MPAAFPTAEFRIGFKAPLDLRASFAPLGRWGDDGIDRWDGTTLVRTVRLRGEAIPYSAVVAGGVAAPALTVTIPANAAQASAELVHEVGGTFVSAPPSLSRLAAADASVGRLVRLYPGIAPVVVSDPFSALIRSISTQQVNLPWAATIRRRIAERYGNRHQIAATFVHSLHPEPLADATVEELRGLQLTTAKARSVLAVARAAVAGELERTDLQALDDDALMAHLTNLPGIGRWSAEWFLARTLGRPRVVAGDLGVRKALARLYGLPLLPSEDDVRRLTAHWGDAATVVQALALYDLAATGPAA